MYLLIAVCNRGLTMFGVKLKGYLSLLLSNAVLTNKKNKELLKYKYM